MLSYVVESSRNGVVFEVEAITSGKLPYLRAQMILDTLDPVIKPYGRIIDSEGREREFSYPASFDLSDVMRDLGIGQS